MSGACTDGFITPPTPTLRAARGPDAAATDVLDDSTPMESATDMATTVRTRRNTMRHSRGRTAHGPSLWRWLRCGHELAAPVGVGHRRDVRAGARAVRATGCTGAIGSHRHPAPGPQTNA